MVSFRGVDNRIVLQQGDDHALNPGLILVLNPVPVFVEPCEITEGKGQQAHVYIGTVILDRHRDLRTIGINRRIVSRPLLGGLAFCPETNRVVTRTGNCNGVVPILIGDGGSNDLAVLVQDGHLDTCRRRFVRVLDSVLVEIPPGVVPNRHRLVAILHGHVRADQGVK